MTQELHMTEQSVNLLVVVGDVTGGGWADSLRKRGCTLDSLTLALPQCWACAFSGCHSLEGVLVSPSSLIHFPSCMFRLLSFLMEKPALSPIAEIWRGFLDPQTRAILRCASSEPWALLSRFTLLWATSSSTNNPPSPLPCLRIGGPRC